MGNVHNELIMMASPSPRLGFFS